MGYCFTPTPLSLLDVGLTARHRGYVHEPDLQEMQQRLAQQGEDPRLTPSTWRTSLREQERELQAQLPVRPKIRLFDVIERRRLQIDRLLAELQDLADAKPDRYGPLVTAVGFPVGGD